MVESDPNEVLKEMIKNFVENLAAHVHGRSEAWKHSQVSRQVQEVLAGTLARQATLATELATNPSIWNMHTAPLLLRPMVESCINIAWILRSPEERSIMFVNYGLGQENLLLEQSKATLREIGEDPDKDTRIQEWEQWINSQRYTFLTEVNVGNWGGLNLREMADEVNLLDLHRYDYALWSGAVHNTWHHIAHFNIQQCVNSLHGHHRIPEVSRPGFESVHLVKAAEYMDLTNELLDKALGINVDVAKPTDILDQWMSKLSEYEPEGHRRVSREG